VLTADRFTARVIGTDIAIVAIEEFDPPAFSIYALVDAGAGIAVVAIHRVLLIDTACERVAAIEGAEIPVVAVGGQSAHTLPGDAEVAEGTSISVLAGYLIRARYKSAFPCNRVTGGCQTWSIGTIGCGAIDNRVGIHDTEVRKLRHIADESTVAEVTILEGLTIVVHLTVTVHRVAGAFATAALIANRAGIFIITINRIGSIYALPTLRVAAIISA